MKVILLADVKKLGKKDQTIEVSDGYAVNFLFPRKLAVQVTKKSVEVLENQQEQRRENDAKMKADAQELAKRLDEITLKFKVKTGREGKLFGAISLKQVAEELNKQFNIEIDKRKFVDKGPLDVLGFHHLSVELYKGVFGKVHVQLEEEK
ncbi:MAG: 50S ribosomal protein L9 [Bacilli bacterium]|nr:50S ribosomal protein L9 [Bacilli bacterium]